MRTFHIDFLNTENSLPDGNILGNQGEHNATVLAVTPPAEMTANENITSYRIAFELSNCRAVHSNSIAKSDVISLPLFAQITSSETIAVQLEGYDENGDIVVKSPKIKKLKFNPSVCGVEIPPGGSPNSMAAEVTANTTFRNKFGEDENGNLTYKGTSVSGRDYKTITLVSGEFGVFPSDYGAEIVLYTSEIPVGAEIRTIRFAYEGQTIDIRNLTAINSVPYILHMGEVYASSQTGNPVAAFIGDYIMLIGGVWQASRSFILQAIESYEVPQIEIDYYT